MRTNKEKYDHYRKIYLEREAWCVKNFFKDGVPEIIYELNMKGISEKTVTGVSFYNSAAYPDDKPTRVQVAAIKELAENPTIDYDEIRLEYKQGDCSGADKYSKILAKDYCSFERATLEPKLEENLKKYTVGENQFACAYCQKAVNNTDKVTSTLIYRSRDRFGKAYVARDDRDYCSSQCASYDQMGHEG